MRPGPYSGGHQLSPFLLLMPLPSSHYHFVDEKHRVGWVLFIDSVFHTKLYVHDGWAEVAIQASPLLSSSLVLRAFAPQLLLSRTCPSKSPHATHSSSSPNPPPKKTCSSKERTSHPSPPLPFLSLTCCASPPPPQSYSTLAWQRLMLSANPSTATSESTPIPSTPRSYKLPLLSDWLYVPHPPLPCPLPHPSPSSNSPLPLHLPCQTHPLFPL